MMLFELQWQAPVSYSLATQIQYNVCTHSKNDWLEKMQRKIDFF